MAVSEHVWTFDVVNNREYCTRCGWARGHERAVCRPYPGHVEYEAPSHPNETQVGGSHYKSKGIQPCDYIAANNLGYFEGNAVKYVSRWREKGGVEDLRKAIHYIEKLISIELDSDD